MIDSQIVSFTFAAAVLTVTPGQDTMLVVRNVLRGGRGDGVVTTFGICAGLFMHATLSALGVSLLLTHSAIAFQVVRGRFRGSDSDRDDDSVARRPVRPSTRGTPPSLSDRRKIRQRWCRRGHRVRVDPPGGAARVRRRSRLDALEAINMDRYPAFNASQRSLKGGF
jgi:hypothetical protein